MDNRWIWYSPVFWRVFIGLADSGLIWYFPLFRHVCALARDSTLTQYSPEFWPTQPRVMRCSPYISVHLGPCETGHCQSVTVPKCTWHKIWNSDKTSKLYSSLKRNWTSSMCKISTLWRLIFSWCSIYQTSVPVEQNTVGDHSKDHSANYVTASNWFLF
jgi:hypothetical protein